MPLQVYNWIKEIEIEFEFKRLGIELYPIAVEQPNHADDFSEFTCQVRTILKCTNGKAGSVELHNWSVKSKDEKLVPGMRVTWINDTHVIGYSFDQVVALIKKTPRPFRMKFADVDLGLMDQKNIDISNTGCHPDEDPSGKNEENQNSYASSGFESYMNSLAIQKKVFSEYQSLLVVEEIKKENLLKENLELVERSKSLSKRIKVMKTASEELTGKYQVLETRSESLKDEENALLYTVQDLQSIMQGKTTSKECERAMDLELCQTGYQRQKDELTNENRILRKERKKLSRIISELNIEEVEELHSECFGQGSTLSEDTIAELGTAMGALAALDEEIRKEQAKITAVEEEVAGLIIKSNRIDDMWKAQDKLISATVQVVTGSASHPVGFPVRNNREFRTSSIGGSTRDSPEKTINAAHSVQTKPVANSNLILPKHAGFLYKFPRLTYERSQVINNVNNFRKAKERYCLLDGTGRIVYFKRKGDTKERGHFNLTEESVEIVSDYPTSTSFVISSCTEQIKFIAKSRDELGQWMRALSNQSASSSRRWK